MRISENAGSATCSDLIVRRMSRDNLRDWVPLQPGAASMRLSNQSLGGALSDHVGLYAVGVSLVIDFLAVLMDGDDDGDGPDHTPMTDSGPSPSTTCATGTDEG